MMTFDQAEKLLDEGKLEMMRPWGDYVPVTRAGRTYRQYTGGKYKMIPVRMENDVLASISQAWDRFGQRGLRERAS